MKWAICALMGWGVVLGSGFHAVAESMVGIALDARVIDETKRLDKEVRRGVGFTQKFLNSYSAELKNTSISIPLEGIRLRMIPFYIPYDFERRDKGHQPGKVQVKENITLAPDEKLILQFEPEGYEKGEFKNVSNSSTGTLTTITHTGNEYAGVIMEIYINDRLVGVSLDGNTDLRRAYEVWVARETNTPVKKNSGPTLMR